MNCEHATIVRDDSVPMQPTWKCSKCPQKFLPGYAVAGIVSEEVDTVASVASAMLWDFHERAVEKYGKDSAQADALKPGHDAPEDDDPCDEQHDWYLGACRRPGCNASQFLGGE